MKISRLEFVAVLLAAVCVAFSAGWFLRGNAAAQPVWVESERTLVQTTPLAAPSPTPAPEPTPTPAPQSKQEALEGGEKVNLNTAGREELMTLPGIGEKRADAILAYRQANGPFSTPEELTDVDGIGEGILEGLIDYVTTGEETK